MGPSRSVAAVLFVIAATATPSFAQAPVAYHLTFPEPEHRWMQVDVSFTGLPAAPLDLHMSRASPGRYALHEFAKNVFDVRITDAGGKPLVFSRPAPHRWL